jgi:hypothetical protein
VDCEGDIELGDNSLLKSRRGLRGAGTASVLNTGSTRGPILKKDGKRPLEQAGFLLDCKSTGADSTLRASEGQEGWRTQTDCLTGKGVP